jgi:hypothetical protein
MRKVAVVTVAVSEKNWFKKWHQYYGRVVGEENLFVLTVKSGAHRFADFPLGKVLELPHQFDDRLGAHAISDFVGVLLSDYDLVVRVDVDEFLVPDPRSYVGLRDYLERMTLPYVTAFGLDLFERVGEAPVDMDRPLLGEQRQSVVVAPALHKTSVTGVPIRWAPGFHSATVPPVFDDLYLIHVKLADIGIRLAHTAGIVAATPEDTPEHRYHAAAFAMADKLRATLTHRILNEPKEAWGELVVADVRQRFLDSVTSGNSQFGIIFQGDFTSGYGSVFVLPVEFFSSF